MEGSLVPSTKANGRLSFAPKLVIFGFLLLVPLSFVSWQYVTQQARTQIQFHEQERRGIQYIRPVTALLLQVVETRVGSGGDIDAAVAAVDAADKQHGKALEATQPWAAWKDLLGMVRSGSGAPSFDEYDQLTKGLTDLVTHVANTSNLILDPDLDSYYLMDVTIVRAPMLLDQVGRAVQLAASSHVAAGNRDRLVIARSAIGSTADAIAIDLTTAIDNTEDPRVKSATAPLSPAFARSVAETSEALANVLSAGRPSLDVSALLAAMSKLDAVCAQRLDSLIAGRIAILDDRVGTITKVILLLSALLVLLATGLSRALRMVRQKTEELRFQALHDGLTGLPNRSLVLDRVEQALARARRGNTPLAVLFLDLDSFKSVNDTYGHAAGDQLLQAVSARLRSALREIDTVGRLGGDEFVVVAEGAALAMGPEVIAERIQSGADRPVRPRWAGGDRAAHAREHRHRRRVARGRGRSAAGRGRGPL